MSASEMTDEMLAVLCRRVFKMRDEKFTLEDTAEALGRTSDEIIEILNEAEERGIIERP